MNLRLLQISDSALPISGYTHSWGLEAAIAQKRVFDPESLERFAASWLRTSLGPLEGILVGCGCRAALEKDSDKLRELNEIADVSILPPTIRGASREMGEQLMQLGATWSWSASPLQRFLESQPRGWHHSIAFGLLGAIAEGSPEEVVTAFLHQAALGIIGAGVRAVPIGHTHGQQILAYLHDDIGGLAKSLSSQPLEVAGAGCPFYEILCDEQTRLYARMFRS